MSHHAGDNSPITMRAAIKLAHKEVLTDLAEFSEWLGVLPDHASSDYEMRQPGRLSGAAPGTLLHALLTCTDSELPLVRRELVTQYLTSQEARIDELIGQFMEES